MSNRRPSMKGSRSKRMELADWLIAAVVITACFLAMSLTTVLFPPKAHRGGEEGFVAIHDVPLVTTVKGYSDLLSLGRTTVSYGPDEMIEVRSGDLTLEDKRRISLWLRMP